MASEKVTVAFDKAGVEVKVFASVQTEWIARYLTREEAQALIAQLQAALAAGSEPKAQPEQAVLDALYGLMRHAISHEGVESERERLRGLAARLPA